MQSKKKETSHKKIVASAEALVKEKGINRTSVAEVMEGAGMTVGGFYAHFPSKEALVAETVSEALCGSRERFEAAAGDTLGADWLRAVARAYLSRAHRDNPQAGCPLPATAGEIANADASVRQAFSSELNQIAGLIASHETEAGVAEPRAEALAGLSTMVGGLTLSRALGNTAFSDEILLACRRHIDRCLGEA